MVLGTIGPAVPLGIAFGLRKRSAALLFSLRAWMIAHNTAILCVLLVVIGARLVGDGLSALAA